jgi:uncharacterized protein
VSAWLSESGDSVVLSLHVQPSAKKTEVVGQHGDALKIRLAAPPAEGKANECLLAYVAEALNIPKRQVRWISGLRSRNKRIAVEGMTAEEIERRMAG